MAKITIEGKEHRVSKTVKDEIVWQDVRISSAIKIAEMIEEKQLEIEVFTRTKNNEIKELINQLKKYER